MEDFASSARAVTDTSNDGPRYRHDLFGRILSPFGVRPRGGCWGQTKRAMLGSDPEGSDPFARRSPITDHGVPPATDPAPRSSAPSRPPSPSAASRRAPRA